DLYALIEEVARELQARANDKGLTGSAAVDPSCPRFVIGDATRLRQVLLWLIDNSLKYTSIGSVRLHAGTTEHDGRLQLRFDVIDTGVGLSKAVQNRLFQPCIEINTYLGEVTGLGLPIARELAKLMGGDIGCKSVVGQGSLYWLTLPAQHAQTEEPIAREPPAASAPLTANEAQVPPASSEANVAPAAGEASVVPARSESAGAVGAHDLPHQDRLSGHVLVAEDNAVNRVLIGTYLNEFGLSYEMVSTGSAVVMYVATKSYDLVLL